MLSSTEHKFIRVCWTDFSGISRCKVVPKTSFEKIQKHGVAVIEAVFGLPFMYDALSDGTASGEIQMVPVLSTMVDLPYHKRHQSVIARMINRRDGSPFELCPRFFLERAISALKESFGITVKVGFEIEFVLYKGHLEAVDSAVYAESSALNANAVVLDAIVDALFAQGIDVLMFHKESASGQYEIVLQYDDVSKAADSLVIARETIKGVANSHGLKATMVPKVRVI